MEDAAGQVLEVDLVNDADAGRDNAEGLEGLLAPLEELVALSVAPELHVEVQLHRIGPAVVIDLDGVVDDEVDRNEGLDDAGLAAEAGDGTAHGGEIDKEGDAGEVLEDDAGDDEGDLLGGRGLGVPGGQGLDVLLMHLASVAVTQNRLEDHADRVGEAGDLSESLLLEGGKRVVGAGLALGGLEGADGLERVGAHGGMGFWAVRLLGYWVEESESFDGFGCCPTVQRTNSPTTLRAT